MNTNPMAARQSLQHAFNARRETLQRLSRRLRECLDSADNAAIRRAFHELSAAIEGRIVWEQGTVLPVLNVDPNAAESGCVAHVENDHLVLLRLLDAFGDWLVGQPLTLDADALASGVRHYDRLWNLLNFHEQREADFTYPTLTTLLSGAELMRLSGALQASEPFSREFASAA